MNYFLFNKPFNHICSFTEGDKNLSGFNIPKGVYAAGRLDKDSEGLILLTDDGQLINKLLSPSSFKEKTYLVQVERVPDNDALEKLRNGTLVIKGHHCAKAKVKLIEDMEMVYGPRVPPVRFRKNVPTAWIEMIITEGKNRQVRRMTAAVGYPTLRLIRSKILNLDLNNLEPGNLKKILRSDINC